MPFDLEHKGCRSREIIMVLPDLPIFYNAFVNFLKIVEFKRFCFFLVARRTAIFFGSIALLKWRRIMTEILQKRCCSMRYRCFDVSGSEKLLNKLSALGKAMTLMETIPNPDSIQTKKPFIRVQVERKFK